MDLTKSNNNSKKPWYKKWWIWVIVAVVLIGIGSSGAKKQEQPSQASSNTTATQQEATKSEPKKAEEPKELLTPIGTYAKDKDFEFRVNSMKCGEKSVGGNYLHTEARGHFCRLNISLKSVSDKPKGIFTTSHQKVFDSQNREFEHDSIATLYAANNVSWYDRLNPGIEVSGDLLFDVPVDADLTRLEIKEQTFSKSIKLSLK